ncbi:hypothetical protein ACQP1P_38835 [Dactylosporangium sp. CA-052675]|uniref:hypothetical protein n=1 Tax=Dactylosporangium sp. CA-052675 TaxID=3239927 RepID=UPI003D9407B7
MSRFSCPCGLEADVPADEMLDFVNAHECRFHKAAPVEPKTAHQAWAGVAELLLFTVLVLGVCSLCMWGLTR